MFANAELITEMNRLQKFACKLTHNKSDADDLVQSTILRAIEKKHLFEPGSNLFSWTSKIMYNLFVSSYRRKTRFESQYDPDIHIQNESVAASQDTHMEFQDVDRAMAALSEEHKAVLMMICVNGMRYSEVSESLQIPVGTVRSRLSRARDALQDALKDVNPELMAYTAANMNVAYAAGARA